MAAAIPSGSPVAVVGIDGSSAAAEMVSTGLYHTCVVLQTGAVNCWGADGAGQLGDGGANTDQATPVAVSGLDGTNEGAVAVSADSASMHGAPITGSSSRTICFGAPSTASHS